MTLLGRLLPLPNRSGLGGRGKTGRSVTNLSGADDVIVPSRLFSAAYLRTGLSNVGGQAAARNGKTGKAKT